jgi:hypothetical protein
MAAARQLRAYGELPAKSPPGVPCCKAAAASEAAAAGGSSYLKPRSEKGVDSCIKVSLFMPLLCG